MKKIVLTFGIISGLTVSVLMGGSLLLADTRSIAAVHLAVYVSGSSTVNS